MMKTKHRLRALLRMIGLASAVFASAVGFGPTASGAVLTLVDGRQFEGRVVEDSPSGVRIDSVVAGVRVTLGLKRHEIASLEKRALPEGFFDTGTKAGKRRSEPSQFPPGATLYLEVPFVGRIGPHIVPRGIARCLAYASRNGIEHVVFFLDSRGGDQVAAHELKEILDRYDDRLTYHALVRDAVGLALIVAVYCDNVFLLPGANLGGSTLIFGKEPYEGDVEILRSQLAHKAAAIAGKHGWHSDILVRAMIDPSETLAAWRTSQKAVELGRNLPPEIPESDVLFVDGPDSALTLSRSQAMALKVARGFKGRAAGLGALLGFKKWMLESDFGKEMMARATRSEQRRMRGVAARNAKRVKRNLHRREKTRRYIERNLKDVNEWDSEQATNSTYSDNAERWNNYLGWGNPQKTTVTRKQMRQQSYRTLRALKRARKGVLKMQKLELEAKELGLEPSYPDGQLDTILRDLVSKFKIVSYHRSARVRR